MAVGEIMPMYEHGHLHHYLVLSVVCDGSKTIYTVRKID